MEVDELYGLPLDRFIAERTALAKALKADGQKEEAAAVAGLRKPSVAAWAVNQLVRTQGAAMAELFDAGDALASAQSDVLAGRGNSADLRAAVERERNVVDGLVDIARGLLTSEGQKLSPAVLERVAETLHAAALGDDARRAISQGRLERELRHVGLGGDMGLAAAGPASAGRKGGGAAKPDRVRSKPEAGTAAKSDARAAAKERDEARRAARVAEGDARRRLDVATRALKAAQARRDLAAQALAEAESEVKAAQAEADAAGRAHTVAKATLESF